MPIEYRDESSGAKLFIPTTSEKAIIRSQKELTANIKDVENLKKELQAMVDTMKEDSESDKGSKKKK